MISEKIQLFFLGAKAYKPYTEVSLIPGHVITGWQCKCIMQKKKESNTSCIDRREYLALDNLVKLGKVCYCQSKSLISKCLP
jgi:hypothetical protein